jgi:hypothetical protein
MKKIAVILSASVLAAILGVLCYVYYMNFYSPCERLFSAIAKNDMPAVRELLRSGVDPNCSDERLRSPLAWASTLQRREMVNLLLENGSDCNYADPSGYTPLMYASQNRDLVTVKILLAHGADPAKVNFQGKNAAGIASEHHAQEIVKLLSRK